MKRVERLNTNVSTGCLLQISLALCTVILDENEIICKVGNERTKKGALERLGGKIDQ